MAPNGKPDERNDQANDEQNAIAVGTAREEKLQSAEGLDAREMKPRSDALRRMGQAPRCTRWVDHNKRDTSNPEYRSSLHDFLSFIPA